MHYREDFTPEELKQFKAELDAQDAAYQIIGDVVYHDMITSGGAVTEVKETLVKVQCRHNGDEYWFKKDSLRLHK